MFYSDNELLRLYDNQDISKDPETDDQVVPFSMVEKLDITIGCINNVFKLGVPSKPKIVIQTWKNTHDKVIKEKCMPMLNIIDIFLCLVTKDWKIVELIVMLKLFPKKVTT